jgi:hypothetical protein
VLQRVGAVVGQFLSLTEEDEDERNEEKDEEDDDEDRSMKNEILGVRIVSVFITSNVLDAKEFEGCSAD